MVKVFINGVIYTYDESQPIVQAVVTKNGRFIDRGTSSEMLLQWEHQTNETIDLQGKTVTPGLIDSHLHIAGIAGNFLDLDVTGVTSKDNMLEQIRIQATTLERGEWLIGRGWDENLFADDSIPTIEELDEVAPHCPLFIPRICGHAFLVNHQALEVSQYHPTMAIPEGGAIVLCEKTGEPTGLLLESASELITKHIPKKTYQELKNAMRKAILFAMEKGLTSVHTNDPTHLGGLGQTYQIYDELLNGEQLGLRCNLLIDHIYLKELKQSGMYAGYGNDTLQIGAVKIFADGALGRRTALLSEPYADAQGIYGDGMFDQLTLSEIIKEARDLSMPVAVHTIGDQALENVLDVLDQFPPVAYRDRLIHVQVMREALRERLAIPSRIADIQPRFVASDFPWVEERLGTERTKLAYAWKSLIDTGVICAGGSDAPVEPIDPLLGIHAAITRTHPEEGHCYNEKERLSIHEAFKLFTVMGAYPTNEETIKGTISRGKLADMTVYSDNPFKLVDADALLEIDIDLTIIGGDIKYEKDR